MLAAWDDLGPSVFAAKLKKTLVTIPNAKNMKYAKVSSKTLY